MIRETGNQQKDPVYISFSQQKINIDSEKYPRCIVWTPLPIVSFIMPCIGHVGIGMSDGVIYDFADSFKISVDKFTFGEPFKYIQLNDLSIQDTEWDCAIIQASEKFKQLKHHYFKNNCHHHVVNALNYMNYQGKSNWTQIDIFTQTITKSRYTRTRYIFLNYMGCFILFIIILALFFVYRFVDF